MRSTHSRPGMKKAIAACVIVMGLLAACAPASRPTSTPGPTSLVVTILYPTASSSTQMGQNIKGIVKVLDEHGKAVMGAQVTLSIVDAAGKLAGRLPATVGSGDVYRTALWMIPHKMHEGAWTLQAEADQDGQRQIATSTFQVKNSTSEHLLNNYGFWIGAPTLRGITPFVGKEQGDAENGYIVWGGQLPSQHIFPENWLAIHWREGDFHLSTEAEVRAFMLGELGNLGFSPVRALGPFERTKFKGWDAWQVRARGQFTRYDEQWMIFYAPEAQKTYAIGTTVVQAPTGIDAHAVLREDFEVHPEIAARGEAPEPLDRLLPSPELLSPTLGARVMGARQPIILEWKAVKDLAADEYYRVKVDYNYIENNPVVEYATRETHIVLPALLYDTPNCGVFNWRVTLMHQTGVGTDGEPEGKALSYDSLYWYVEWLHPLDEPASFDPLCPNPQT